MVRRGNKIIDDLRLLYKEEPVLFIAIFIVCGMVITAIVFVMHQLAMLGVT